MKWLTLLVAAFALSISSFTLYALLTQPTRVERELQVNAQIAEASFDIVKRAREFHAFSEFKFTGGTGHISRLGNSPFWATPTALPPVLGGKLDVTIVNTSSVRFHDVRVTSRLSGATEWSSKTVPVIGPGGSVRLSLTLAPGKDPSVLIRVDDWRMSYR